MRVLMPARPSGAGEAAGDFAERERAAAFRRDGVDSRQIRVVPGRNDKHNTMRQAPYEPSEAGILANLDIGQCGSGNRRHMAGPLLNPAKLAAIAHRAPHHTGQLGDNFVIRRTERFDTGIHQRNPFIERARCPRGLRRTSGFDGGRCSGGIHRLAHSHNSPVDR